MIDFVCNNTGYGKMYLVTYSMSSAVLMAAVSARPEYNDKIVVSYHLAPFIAFTNIRSTLLRIGVQLGQIYLVSVARARFPRRTLRPTTRRRRSACYRRKRGASRNSNCSRGTIGRWIRCRCFVIKIPFSYARACPCCRNSSDSILPAILPWVRISDGNIIALYGLLLQKDLDFKLTYSRAGVSLNSLDHVFQMIKSSE